ARNSLPALRPARYSSSPSVVTDSSSRMVFASLRKLLYGALESGEAARIGLDRAVITTVPRGGRDPLRSRSPFTDEVARALADEANLCRLHEVHDRHDRGFRDAWEAIVFTGRRCREVLELRVDCIGRYGGLP